MIAKSKCICKFKSANLQLKSYLLHAIGHWSYLFQSHQVFAEFNLKVLANFALTGKALLISFPCS